MRYLDWDILLFPTDSKIPVKEFKVGCSTVDDYDPELAHQGVQHLPVMNCWIPSLATGTPFRISVHSWNPPELSQYLRRHYHDHLGDIKFEVRVLINGIEIACVSPQLQRAYTNASSLT